MTELTKIEESLDELHKDFNKQLEALGSDSKEFYNALIDLSAKYPDQKELLQFIVFINDKLETNQSLFSEIVIDSFNELIKTKKVLVKKLKEEKTNTKPSTDISVWEKAKNITSAIKNSKMALSSLAIISLAIASIIEPEMLLEIIKALLKLL